MAQTIKLKRSATQGAVPSTSALALGEIAINTYDGNIFIKKNDGSESIVTIGDLSDNAVTSAKIAANAVQASEIAANAVGISELNVSDGTNGQVLTTDGSGSLSFSSKVSSAQSFYLNSATGDGSTTDFSLSTTPAAESNIIAFIDGVFQTQDSYTFSGTTLSFSAAPPNGTEVTVYVVGAIFNGNSVVLDTFSGDGSTTAFTLSENPENENNTQIYIDGVYQQKSEYSISSQTLTFSSAPPSGTNNIEVVSFAVTNLTVLNANSVESASIATGAVTIGKIADAALVIESEGISSNDNDTTLPTSAAVKDYVDSQVAGKDALSELSGDTDDVTEGSTNLYYTDARARASISEGSTQLSYNSSTGVLTYTQGNTDTVSEGSSNLYFTNERVDDRVSALVQNGTGISFSYNDSAGTLTPTVTLTPFDTDALSEGSTNLYYTDARVGTYISGDRTYGNITTTGYIAGPATFTIDPAAVGDNTGTVVIAGNLQVDGTTTTINSTTMEVDDLNITLASGAANAAAANGAGITVDGASATITYDGTNDEWDFNKDINVTGTITSSGTITGTLATAAQPNITSVGTLTGLTTTGDINFGDNDKAIFGAGSDLQIYSDGSNSIIHETDGTGNLIIKATNINLQNSGGTATLAQFIDGGKSSLRYSGSEKLATTATGINVTGTATMDGLTVDGQETINKNYAFGASNYHIKLGEDTSDSYIGNVNGSAFMATGTYYGSNQYTLTGGATSLSGMYIDGTSGIQLFSESGLTANSTNTRKQRMNISTGGDISFYEDTGTTAKLFWDASAESLGIGTTSPSANLHVSSSGDTIARITSADGNGAFLDLGDASDPDGGRIVYDSGSNLAFSTASAERLRIDSSGRVGIGTTSPTQKLDVNGTVELNNLTVAGSQGTDGQVLTSTGSGIAWENAAGTTINNNAANRIITGSGTANTLEGEANFFFDGTNVGINETSPDFSGFGSNGGGIELDDVGSSFTAVKVSQGSTGNLYLAVTTGAGYLWQHSNSPLVIGTNNTEHIRISEDGKLYIGTTTDDGGTNQKLIINDGIGISMDRSIGAGSGYGPSNSGGANGSIELYSSATGATTISNGYAAGPGVAFKVGGSGGINEAMRISGNSSNNSKTLYLNTTSIWGSAGAHNMAMQFDGNRGTGIGFKQYSSTAQVVPLQFYNSGAGSAGNITYTYSSTAYNTSSDYRLKEQVQDMPSAINMIKALKPKTFEWKTDPNDTLQYGFLAHEVQDVFPNAVTGEKDAVKPAELDEDGNEIPDSTIDPQSIDHSKLVPLLVKTIQELEARITTLENA